LRKKFEGREKLLLLTSGESASPRWERRHKTGRRTKGKKGRYFWGLRRRLGGGSSAPDTHPEEGERSKRSMKEEAVTVTLLEESIYEDNAQRGPIALFFAIDEWLGGAGGN